MPLAKKSSIEVSRIMRVYYSATAAEIAAGTSWYLNAQMFCETLSERYSVDVKIAAGIVATLSPGAPWERNQIDAELVCAAFRKRIWVASKYFPKVGTYGEANRKKCEKIWRTGDPPMGQKVRAFYDCILGEYQTVCIDRHAYSVTVGERRELQVSKRQYEAMQEFYRIAASMAGVPPAILQAVVWVVWRQRADEFFEEE